MIKFYKEMSEWAMYNWINFPLFYYALVMSGVSLGVLIVCAINRIADKIKNTKK